MRRARIPLLMIAKILSDKHASRFEIQRAIARAKEANGDEPAKKKKKKKTAVKDDDEKPDTDDDDKAAKKKKKAAASTAALVKRGLHAVRSIEKHRRTKARIERDEARGTRRAEEDRVWRKMGLDPAQVRRRVINKKRSSSNEIVIARELVAEGVTPEMATIWTKQGFDPADFPALAAKMRKGRAA